MTSYLDIPVAHTPPGGYGATMPPPILDGCADPPAAGAPELRGTWRIIALTDDAGVALADDHPMHSYTERIEQAGNRVVITAAGIVHDMYADGTFERGVNDVIALDFTTPIVVAATFEGDGLVLRPQGMPGVEIWRWREAEHLMWRYHSAFVARMERVDAGAT